MHFIYPKLLAEKIDEVYGKDITDLSLKMNELAEQWSWETLRDKYLKLFEELCQK